MKKNFPALAGGVVSGALRCARLQTDEIGIFRAGLLQDDVLILTTISRGMTTMPEGVLPAGCAHVLPNFAEVFGNHRVFDAAVERESREAAPQDKPKG